jgi:hypothetical protein
MPPCSRSFFESARRQPPREEALRVLQEPPEYLVATVAARQMPPFQASQCRLARFSAPVSTGRAPVTPASTNGIAAVRDIVRLDRCRKVGLEQAVHGLQRKWKPQ